MQALRLVTQNIPNKPVHNSKTMEGSGMVVSVHVAYVKLIELTKNDALPAQLPSAPASVTCTLRNKTVLAFCSSNTVPILHTSVVAVQPNRVLGAGVLPVEFKNNAKSSDMACANSYVYNAFDEPTTAITSS